MASVASAGTSPLSGYEFPQTESTGDADENAWAFVPIPSSAGPNSSVGFFPSPASATLGSSWGFIGHGTQSPEQPASLPAASPLNLDTDQPHLFTDPSFGDQTASAFSATSTQQTDNQFILDNLFQANNDFFAPQGNSLLTTQFADLSSLMTAGQFAPLSSAEQAALASLDFDIPSGILSGVDVPPWNPATLRDAAAAQSQSQQSNTTSSSPVFVMEDPSFISPSPPQHFSPSVSPRSPPIHIKHEDLPSSAARSAPVNIRKVRGDNSRITKSKGSSSSSSSKKSPSPSTSHTSTFLIITADTVNAHASKSNPFDCHDHARSSQRGRKGPLANETKQSALKVRRLGACFHCHARKVKCGEERPCRNCTKLKLTVPHAMCWQFDDFDVVLFPEFIRGHFARDEMQKFISDNIESFTVGGVEKGCTVELSSGMGFASTMSIKAKFFTAKTGEVLKQWHLNHVRGVADLQARGAAPIGLDGASYKEELRKKTERYINGIVNETAFAEMVTDARHTRLPRTILRIVQDYATRTDNAMVKRALSIYAMHYVMTVQLCLTAQTVASLAATELVPQGVPFVTPRVLNRQVKAVIDDLMRAEMTKLFKAFGSALKPKERRGWAPCLAAFLVLCLFMESVETAADTFVISENQIAVREGETPKWKRAFALGKNKEIENMPFKQVAFQFHQLYQTHSRDAGAKSWNPLFDDACLEPGELDRDAAAMVMQLRRLLQEPNWSELDFLSMDPILPKQEKYPIHDVAFNYTGRLVAKFLLSFDDERYIIERND
ncbi:hypothetical protein QBC34DRAFT_416161 [Podospora aff. communis PSN243]|uniref:Zn(2)-C6 fungal-type domain-containing protein n=1 Tax=Podospora aff. communis PSN243 TaxID=3040156 RepID=A0AAV9G7F9_9PEZI|nr:hypothetical protein QBC34DRAFT_416161 [Podospora aff. communis PSN243]